MYSYSVFNEHPLLNSFVKLYSYSESLLNPCKVQRLFIFLLFPSFMGSSGLEPPTSRLSGARSNHLSYEPFSLLLLRLPCSAFPTRHGGDDGIRTHDPLLAGQVLSQLSYTPTSLCSSLKIEQHYNSPLCI